MKMNHSLNHLTLSHNVKANFIFIRSSNHLDSYWEIRTILHCLFHHLVFDVFRSKLTRFVVKLLIFSNLGDGHTSTAEIKHVPNECVTNWGEAIHGGVMGNSNTSGNRGNDSVDAQFIPYLCHFNLQASQLGCDVQHFVIREPMISSFPPHQLSLSIL